MRSRIKELAKSRGLSLWALAARTGLTPSAFYKWERIGLEHAQLGAMLRVAKALDCSINDLYGE